ncbi:tubulin delta chain-like [Octopus sinensis]|uniref:Tubulin delta chain n=1 Tax=Octopus sinensis TaxID=2607531 RepID=A0A7E6EHV2_9MOLL|nr:tubulin delta chain-like [Octopus sinensis]
MDIVQKEVERFDKIEGFLVNMSVAGGTGSGLGSLITQQLCDSYKHSLKQIVWPFSSGEVSVQAYNTLLTLSSLYDNSDALLVVENDGIRKLSSRYAGYQRISSKNPIGFQMINKVISRQFASVILPAGHIDLEQGPTKLNRILECVAPNPQFKLLNIRSVPHTSYSSAEYEFHQWDGLVRYLRQMLASNSHIDNWSALSSRALSSMLFLRGNEIHRFNTNILNSSHGCRYGAFGDSLTVWASPRSLGESDKFASVLTNGQSLLPSLKSIVEKAWLMFSFRAFVHQYERQGMETEEFDRAFDHLELILKNYSKL